MAFHDYSVQKRKSAGEQVKDMAVYLMAMAAVYFVFYFLFLVISWPFRMLFMSERQRFQAKANRAKAKIFKRTGLRKVYETSDENPFYQYIERFKLHPSIYWADPENGKYKEWYEAMKAGRILDTKLMWAPEVYETSKDNELTVSQDFLDYFSRQVEMHLKENLGTQIQFLKTVRDFYPEFTPKFSVIFKEVVDYREEVKAGKLREELFKTISKKGASQGLAYRLVETAKTVEGLKQSVVVVQKCQEKDYCEAMVLYCAKYGYDPDDQYAEAVNVILDQIGNENLATAVINGDIGVDEVTEMVYKAKIHGDDLVETINDYFDKHMRTKCQAELARG